nr:MAG TPA: protein of unknown function (DUF5361) [Caudoviricetes sp.]
MLKVRSDEIEADFQRFYSIHLGALFTGELTLRRFSALLFALPPGAAVWRNQGGVMAWSQETAATMLVAHAVQTLHASLSSKPKKVPPPEPPQWGYLEIEAAKIETSERRLQRHLARVGPVKG